MASFSFGSGRNVASKRVRKISLKLRHMADMPPACCNARKERCRRVQWPARVGQRKLPPGFYRAPAGSGGGPPVQPYFSDARTSKRPPGRIIGSPPCCLPAVHYWYVYGLIPSHPIPLHIPTDEPAPRLYGKRRSELKNRRSTPACPVAFLLSADSHAMHLLPFLEELTA